MLGRANKGVSEAHCWCCNNKPFLERASNNGRRHLMLTVPQSPIDPVQRRRAAPTSANAGDAAVIAPFGFHQRRSLKRLVRS